MTRHPQRRPVRLVMDVSALHAYAAGSIHAGETLHEALGDGRVGVPYACAVEALATTSGRGLAHLHRLLTLAEVEVLHPAAADLLVLVWWRRALGRADLAEAAHAAHVHEAVVLTAVPHRYGQDVPVIGLPA